MLLVMTTITGLAKDGIAQTGDDRRDSRHSQPPADKASG